MSKVCVITGKRPGVGHKVSHSNRKTNRRFEPNLVKKRIWDAEEKKFVRIRVSVRGLKTLRKRMK
ncbi:MAG: 50S ribosomal protein L28 [Patescibacteria group bacterium]